MYGGGKGRFRTRSESVRIPFALVCPARASVSSARCTPLIPGVEKMARVAARCGTRTVHESVLMTPVTPSFYAPVIRYHLCASYLRRQ
jgi:hypothetical protein